MDKAKIGNTADFGWQPGLESKVGGESTPLLSLQRL
jgi:hypothetical protein